MDGDPLSEIGRKGSDRRERIATAALASLIAGFDLVAMRQKDRAGFMKSAARVAVEAADALIDALKDAPPAAAPENAADPGTPEGRAARVMPTLRDRHVRPAE